MDRQAPHNDDIPDFVGMFVPEEHGDGHVVSQRSHNVPTIGSDPYPSMAKPRMRGEKRPAKSNSKESSLVMSSSPRDRDRSLLSDLSMDGTPSHASSSRGDISLLSTPGIRGELPSYSSSIRGGDTSFTSTPGGASDYVTASSSMSSSPHEGRSSRSHTPSNRPMLGSFSSPLGSTPLHMKYPTRERVSSASAMAPPTSVPWRANDPAEWTMDRVLYWLDLCKFGPLWQETFRERNICGEAFLSLASYQNLKKLGHFYGRTDDYDNSPSRFLNALRKVLARSSAGSNEIDVEDSKVCNIQQYPLRRQFCRISILFKN
jgi:hypothetical protein